MKHNISSELFEVIPEIDFHQGNRYFLGNMDNYTRALLAILKSVKSKLPLLQTMQNSGEYEGLRMITQTLNKMFTNVGANELALFSSQLEEAIWNENQISVSELLTQYIDSLLEFADHLELLFQSVNLKKGTERGQDTTTFLNYDFSKTKESIKRSNDLLERRII